MTNIPMRRASLALVLAMGALLAFACAPALARHAQMARAQAIRTRCVSALRAHRSWQADIVQTETGSDGRRAVMRERLLVRRSGESRLTLTETDTKGRRVVSTTIRTQDRMVTRRVNADGSTVLHVIKGVRPALGAELDNVLGETVQAVAEATPLKVVGRAARAGMDADKLQLAPGHFVWVARSSGLPIEEQVVSGGMVAHELSFSHVAADVAAPDSEFDPTTLGQADKVITEDLGFCEVSSAGQAAAAIGFAPLSVPAPGGFEVLAQGYVDPLIPNGDAPVEAAFVTSFANGLDGVIVTQSLRRGIGDSVPAAADDGPDPAHATTVAGRPAIIYSDGQRSQIVFARRDVLVTVEGTLSESSMRAFAESIR